MNDHDRPTYAAPFNVRKLAVAEKRVMRVRVAANKKTKPLQKQLDKLDALEEAAVQRVRKAAQKRRAVILRKLTKVSNDAQRQVDSIYKKVR